MNPFGWLIRIVSSGNKQNEAVAEAIEQINDRISARTVAVAEPDGSTRIEPRSQFDAVCDFCGKGCVPLRMHQANDVELAEGHMSVGAWAGCDACSELIRVNDRFGLFERAFARYQPILGDEGAKAMVSSAQGAFWSAQIVLGDARP